MKDKNTVIERLKKANFKLTPQRMAIIETLIGNKTHPSADAIYDKIKKKFPMISYSTIYNTLRILIDLGELRELSIKENKINYDPNTEPHHHFLCEKCNRIIDIFQEINFKSEHINTHKIRNYEIYFYGICSDCLKRIK
jgi:Fur family peroxide stress response transcriptional regulator